MKSSDLSENALSVLTLLSDGKPRVAKVLSNQLTLKRTTLRNALQRMELFGLITMVEFPNHKFDYQITPEGMALIKTHRLAEKAKEVGKTVIPPVIKPQFKSLIQEQMKQQPNIVEWLRSMAASFNAMADQLS